MKDVGFKRKNYRDAKYHNCDKKTSHPMCVVSTLINLFLVV